MALHHVSILTRDVERSVAFYRDVFGLTAIPRPAFSVAGAWLAGGDRQFHLVRHEGGTFRDRGVDNDDMHFAFRIDNFEGLVSRLRELGYREDPSADDAKYMLVKRGGQAGFDQLYIVDPDRNVVEINNATVCG